VKSGLPEWSLSMPLGEEKDPSVLAFLARAEAAGARYKSAPERTPREEGGTLADVLQRVEGRAYGCGDAVSASGCEDKAL
jgi:hypothetical protein